MIDPLERLETLGKISEAKTRKRLGDALEAAVQAMSGAENLVRKTRLGAKGFFQPGIPRTLLLAVPPHRT